MSTNNKEKLKKELEEINKRFEQSKEGNTVKIDNWPKLTRKYTYRKHIIVTAKDINEI